MRIGINVSIYAISVVVSLFFSKNCPDFYRDFFLLRENRE